MLIQRNPLETEKNLADNELPKDVSTPEGRVGEKGRGWRITGHLGCMVTFEYGLACCVLVVARHERLRFIFLTFLCFHPDGWHCGLVGAACHNYSLLCLISLVVWGRWRVLWPSMGVGWWVGWDIN